MTEAALLAAARAGDETAFERLVEPYRRELHAHCYRMLGSLHDAEDALQDAMLRVWRKLKRFEDRSSLRAWLYKIATNTSLDIARPPPQARCCRLEYGPRQPERPPGEPVSEQVWLEPYPDETLEVEDGYAAPDARYEQREAVELAFIAAMQHLPPRQRAVLILREVLGFSAKEVGETLDTSVPSVNSALQRARRVVEERIPDRSQQVTLRSLGEARLRQIVEDYMEAMRTGDVNRVVAMLTEDMRLVDAAAGQLVRRRRDPDLPAQRPAVRRLALAHRPGHGANGELAVGTYTWIEGEQPTSRSPST